MSDMDDHQIERARGMHAMSEAEYEQYMREQMPRTLGEKWVNNLRQLDNVRVFSEEAANPAPPKRKPRLSWWNRLFG